MSKAETLLKHIIKKIGIAFQYKNHKELIAYTKSDIEFIKQQFDVIGHKYRGRCAELVDIGSYFVNFLYSE